VNVEASAQVFGRVAALGAALRVDTRALLQELTLLAPEVSEYAMITVPHTFDRIAVATGIKRRPEVLDRVREVCGEPHARRFDRIAGSDARGAAVELECARDGRVEHALLAFGNRAPHADLSTLRELGMPANPIAESVAGELGHEIAITDRDDGWVLHFEQPNATAEQRAATRARVDRAAALLAVTAAQRHMVDGLHDTLCHGRESFARLYLSHATGAQLAVAWGGVAWEHVVRMMTELYRGEVAEHAGEVAGAFDADAAASVEVGLAPTEPPAMRIAVILRGGQS
jgi:hypothetical protein